MKALIYRPKFVVSLFTLLACASSFVEAQPPRTRNIAPVHVVPTPIQIHNGAPANVAPLHMHFAGAPASMTPNTTSPAAAPKTSSSGTTPSTTPTQKNHRTPSQLQALEQSLLTFAGEDLSLLTRLASGINGSQPFATTVNPFGTTFNPFGTSINPYGTTFNPYGTSINPYANSYAAPANPYAGVGAPAIPSGGYGPGSTYSSTYYISPYNPYAPTPYSSALNPTAGNGNTASPTVLPTQDSETQARDARGGLSTLLTGMGVPNVKGQVTWPAGLETLRPASESHALRQQIGADFRIVASQLLAGTENSTFAIQGNIALARLDVLLRENEKSMTPAVYSEARQFLGKLQLALQVLQPGSRQLPG